MKNIARPRAWSRVPAKGTDFGRIDNLQARAAFLYQQRMLQKHAREHPLGPYLYDIGTAWLMIPVKQPAPAIIGGNGVKKANGASQASGQPSFRSEPAPALTSQASGGRSGKLPGRPQ